ncbi:hypothetical protein CEXT_710391, partial [Caerostris extrusa]
MIMNYDALASREFTNASFSGHCALGNCSGVATLRAVTTSKINHNQPPHPSGSLASPSTILAYVRGNQREPNLLFSWVTRVIICPARMLCRQVWSTGLKIIRRPQKTLIPAWQYGFCNNTSTFQLKMHFSQSASSQVHTFLSITTEAESEILPLSLTPDDQLASSDLSWVPRRQAIRN